MPLKLLAAASSKHEGRTRWHEIELYQSDGRFLARVTYRTCCADERDEVACFTRGALMSLARRLLEYDPLAHAYIPKPFPEEHGDGERAKEKEMALQASWSRALHTFFRLSGDLGVTS
jgi:hypothetical protein